MNRTDPNGGRPRRNRRNRHTGTRRGGGVLAAALLLFGVHSGLAARAVAQCAMCGQATAYAGSSPSRAYATFAGAALVLLVPVLLIMAGFGTLLWKHRN